MALSKVFQKVQSVAELRKISAANLVAGEKSDSGYRYQSDFGFSYQGVSAEDAMKIVARCARALNAHGHVDFEWRPKEGAHKPGEAARIEF